MSIKVLLVALIACCIRGAVTCAMQDVVLTIALRGDAKSSLLRALALDNKLRYCAHWAVSCQVEEGQARSDSIPSAGAAADATAHAATAKALKLTGLLRALQVQAAAEPQPGASALAEKQKSYVLALDLDAVITDPGVDLFALARASAEAGAGAGASLLLTRDLQQAHNKADAGDTGYQTGVIFARRGAESVQLLQQAVEHMHTHMAAGGEGSDQKALNAVLAACRTPASCRHVHELRKSEFNAFAAVGSTETTRRMWDLMQLPRGDEILGKGDTARADAMPHASHIVHFAGVYGGADANVAVQDAKTTAYGDQAVLLIAAREYAARHLLFLQRLEHLQASADVDRRRRSLVGTGSSADDDDGGPGPDGEGDDGGSGGTDDAKTTVKGGKLTEKFGPDGVSSLATVTATGGFDRQTNRALNLDTPVDTDPVNYTGKRKHLDLHGQQKVKQYQEAEGGGGRGKRGGGKGKRLRKAEGGSDGDGEGGRGDAGSGGGEEGGEEGRGGGKRGKKGAGKKRGGAKGKKGTRGGGGGAGAGEGKHDLSSHDDRRRMASVSAPVSAPGSTGPFSVNAAIRVVSQMLLHLDTCIEHAFHALDEAKREAVSTQCIRHMAALSDQLTSGNA